MAVPILTAAGEFAAPYLIKEAGKIGIKKFIETYGSTAFQSIAAGVTGGMITQETPPLDLQQEKLFGMPVSHIAGQGEVYSDIEEPKKQKPLEYIDTVHGGKGPLPPIKSQPFPETKVEPVQEGFEKPEPIETTKGFEVPSEKKIVPPGFEKPKPLGTDILTKDIAKQTKDLVTKEPEFGALTETEIQTAKALKEDKPDFYSRAIEAIKTAQTNKKGENTKGRWASILKSSTTKDELDYLGLTELLVGNESITKQELLDFVKGKDIAATMTVKSIPKEQMNPMYEGYSLGFEKSGTQEHIVFQIGKDDAKVGTLYKEPHFDTEHGTGTFAHARVQVGFGDSDAPPVDYEHLDPTVFDKFNNTLIVDEIQSQWLQEGRIEGFESEWKVYRGDRIPEELEELINKKGITVEDQKEFLKNQYYVFNKTELVKVTDNDEEAYEVIENKAVPDFPIKESKKWVELVLNEMIKKAVIDGRDSIAVTNGQIQYNRYPEMSEEQREGLKKAYDTFVYDQLNKIAKKYGVELERIDISKGTKMAPKELEDIHLDNQIKTAQDNNYTLEKITLQELWDAVKGEKIPDHAALYTNEGRGQGLEYIEKWIGQLVDIPELSTETEPTLELVGKTGYDKWDKIIKHNEVYVWKRHKDDRPFFMGETGSSGIVWEMPTIPVKDTSAVTGENDLSVYTEYLKNYKLVSEGIDLSYKEDTEQLIKMELPKKLQKDILSKPIRLTKKIDEQTQKLVA